MFREVPFWGMEVIERTRPLTPTTPVMGAGETRNVVTREMEFSPVFTMVSDSFGHVLMGFLEAAGST